MRRTSRTESVTYGAVGATQAADLMTYPPTGYRPFEQRTRIGHGDTRWDYAWRATMSWGIQRRSGFRVLVHEDGVSDAPEHDGFAFVAPGDTATLVIPVGPIGVRAPCRVIYLIDEPNRKGFAYGTLPGHPESGEEAFIVDQTDDGSVWLTIRAFSRPASWQWWVVYPFLRIAQAIITRRYFRALTGPLD